MIPPKKFAPPAPHAGRQPAKPIQTKQNQALPTRPTLGPRPPQWKPPAAPPAYRPQPTPKVLQAKTQTQTPPARQPNRPPAAPPVYRPQPVPRVLQTKAAVASTPSPRTQPTARPSAPPVYRPNPAQRCLQTKTAAQTQTPFNASRPAPSAAPPRTGPGHTPPPPTAAPNSFPRVLQQKPRTTPGGAGRGVVQPLAASNVIQMVWVKVQGSGNPGDYYWDDNFGSRPHNAMYDGPPPNGGRAVPSPFQMMQDTHSGRSGGNMTALRTRPDYPEMHFDELVHYTEQLVEGRGVFYEGPTDIRTLGSMQVSNSIPKRSSEYTTNFSHETGYRSSTEYQQSLGVGPQIEGGYQILHIGGHGQIGKISNTAPNLCSGGHGTNSYMIPYDDLTSGDPNVSIASYAVCRQGTLRAERIIMQFFYRGFTEPFFVQEIDGDLGKLTRTQYENIKEDARRRIGDAKLRKAASQLVFMSNSMQDDLKKFGGGQPPPGSGGGGGLGGGILTF